MLKKIIAVVLTALSVSMSGLGVFAADEASVTVNSVKFVKADGSTAYTAKPGDAITAELNITGSDTVNALVAVSVKDGNKLCSIKVMRTEITSGTNNYPCGTVAVPANAQNPKLDLTVWNASKLTSYYKAHPLTGLSCEKSIKSFSVTSGSSTYVGDSDENEKVINIEQTALWESGKAMDVKNYSFANLSAGTVSLIAAQGATASVSDGSTAEFLVDAEPIIEVTAEDGSVAEYSVKIDKRILRTSNTFNSAAIGSLGSGSIGSGSYYATATKASTDGKTAITTTVDTAEGRGNVLSIDRVYGTDKPDTTFYLKDYNGINDCYNASFEFDFMYSNLVTTTTQHLGSFLFGDGSTNRFADIFLTNSNGKLRLGYRATGSGTGSQMTTLAKDTWYNIRFVFTKDAQNVPTMKCYVDNMMVYKTNTLYNNTTTIKWAGQYFTYMFYSTATGTVHFDNVKFAFDNTVPAA